MFYVYVHKRMTDGKVFYVGKGSKKRITDTYTRNKFWHHTVNKHGYFAAVSKSFECEIEAYEYEIKLIKYYRSRKAPLVNIELGGKGGTKGRDMTACMKAAKKSNIGRKKPHSEETKRKLSLAHTGRKMSEEAIEKMRIALIGRPVNEITREKLREAYKKRVENGYVQKAWNKGKSGIYTIEQREQISRKVREYAAKRLKNKGYYGGVCFHKQSGRWQAYTRESNLGVKKQRSQGMYDSKKEAIAYLKKYFPV